MQLTSLLQHYSPIPVQAPRSLREVDALPELVGAVLDKMIGMADAFGVPRAALGLLAANIVVQPADDEDPPSILPGSYVSLSLSGAGAWSTDWRWSPGDASPASGIDSELLQRAGVRFAYGRALGGSSAVTIFLPPL